MSKTSCSYEACEKHLSKCQAVCENDESERKGRLKMCKHEKKLGRFEKFGEVYHLCTNSNCGYLELWSKFEKKMIAEASLCLLSVNWDEPGASRSCPGLDSSASSK